MSDPTVKELQELEDEYYLAIETQAVHSDLLAAGLIMDDEDPIVPGHWAIWELWQEWPENMAA